MEKLEGKSLDISKRNIEELKKIFPEIVTENKIDFEKLRLILGDEVEESNERYEFKWNGKAKAIKISQTPSMGTLRPDKESSKDWDTTQNLYIEGDNLEVLKLLQKAYFGKIKMIYIDPPYNTGKDFVYKDDYRDNIKNYKEITKQTTRANPETSGRYHTDWLNMMYPRLKLARNLLTEDGVIFISIDDNEVANLKKICDEIFGEENFVGQITVVSNPRGRDYGGIARMHDYIIVYSKSENYEMNRLRDENKQFDLFDNIGGFELRELRNRNIKFNFNNRPNLYYPFYVNPNYVDENGLYEVSLEKKAGWIEVYPAESQGVKTVWRWGKQKSKENLNINVKAKKMQNGNFQIVEKYREEKVMARSVWWDKDANTERGTLLIKEILNNKVFDYPKPLEMMRRICEIGSDTDSIILDFFSGSATTAHAVMQLNAEDGGNRKFIMVQLPELTPEDSEAYKAGYKTICEIGKERIRRAGEKIKKEFGKEDLDVGFRVFKLDDSNIKTWDPDYKDLKKDLIDMMNNIKEGRTKEDVLYEIMIKLGIPLTEKIESVNVNGKIIYNIGLGALLICLEDEITQEIIKEIPKHISEFMREDAKIVFLDKGFKNDSDKLNAVQTLKQFGIKEENIRSV